MEFEKIAIEILNNDSFNKLIKTHFEYELCYNTLIEFFEKYFEIKVRYGI